LLYVCSALLHGSPAEAPFALEWIRRVRSSASLRLRDAGILVRPHPSRFAEWEGVDTSGLNAIVWGGNPVDTQSKADYFDSLYHSAAVVGVNTSAFIEAGIAGRPVFTIILPEMEENQTGTVHFDYLLKAGGGLLNVAQDYSEHLTQLDAVLAHPQEGVKPFVREFVRPHGLDRAATPIFVEGVETMAGQKAASPQPMRLQALWSWLVRRIAGARESERLERWVLSSRELESAIRLRNARAAKAIQRAEKRSEKDAVRLRELQERQAELEERQRGRAAERAEWRRQKAAKEAEARTR
jgi:hypothetical protein